MLLRAVIAAMALGCAGCSLLLEPALEVGVPEDASAEDAGEDAGGADGVDDLPVGMDMPIDLGVVDARGEDGGVEVGRDTGWALDVPRDTGSPVDVPRDTGSPVDVPRDTGARVDVGFPDSGCGAAGQRCCTGSTCGPRATCLTSGGCASCGGNGDRCCSTAPACTDPSARCVTITGYAVGRCIDTGATRGEAGAYCATGTCRGSSLECASGYCIRCGIYGLACCSDIFCTSGMECYFPNCY